MTLITKQRVHYEGEMKRIWVAVNGCCLVPSGHMRIKLRTCWWANICLRGARHLLIIAAAMWPARWRNSKQSYEPSYGLQKLVCVTGVAVLRSVRNFNTVLCKLA